MIDIKSHGGEFGGGKKFDFSSLPIQPTLGEAVVIYGQRKVSTIPFHCDDDYIYSALFNAYLVYKFDKKTGTLINSVTSPGAIIDIKFDHTNYKFYILEKYSDYTVRILRYNAITFSLESYSTSFNDTNAKGLVVTSDYAYIINSDYVRKINKDFVNGGNAITVGANSLGAGNVHIQHLLKSDRIAILKPTGELVIFDLNSMTRLGIFSGITYFGDTNYNPTWFINEDTAMLHQAYGSNNANIKKTALNFSNFSSSLIYNVTINQKPVTNLKLYNKKNKLILSGGATIYLLSLGDNTGSPIAYLNVPLIYVGSNVGPLIEDNKREILYAQTPINDAASVFLHSAIIDKESFK